MRRFRILCALLFVLILPVSAQQRTSCAALVFDSGPNGKYTRQLLDGLYDRGIHATFLLRGSAMAEFPDLLSRILEEGHEVACRGYSGDAMVYMSRREIAAEIMAFEALLPENYPLRLFCPPGGCSDGVRQVAEARKLALLSWSADADTPESEILDGDLILLKDTTISAVENALSLADRLLDRDFHLVTVSQLAKQRQVSIRPGQVYSHFPRTEAS